MSIAASNQARPAQRPAGATAAAAPRPAARNPVAAPVTSIRPAAASASAPMFAHLLGADSEEELLHLELSDLPRLSTGLNVEGFKHTVLSRIFSLFIRR